MPEPTNIPVSGNDNSSMTQTPQSVQTVPLDNLGTSNIEETPNITRKVQYAAEGNDPYSQLLSAGDTMIHRAGQDYGEGVIDPNHYDAISAIGDIPNKVRGYRDAYNHFQQVVRPRTTNEALHNQFMQNLRPNGQEFHHINPDEEDDVYDEMAHYSHDLANTRQLVGMPTDELAKEYDQMLRGTNRHPARQVLGGEDADQDEQMMRNQAYSLEELRRMHHELARRGINTAVFNEHDLEGNPIDEQVRRDAIRMAQEHVRSMPSLFAERPSSFYSRMESFRDAQLSRRAAMAAGRVEPEEEEEDIARPMRDSDDEDVRPIHAMPAAAGYEDVPLGVRAGRVARRAGYALADAGDAVRRGFRRAGDAVRGAFRRRPPDRLPSSDGEEMDALVPWGRGLDSSSEGGARSESGSGSGSGDIIDLGRGFPIAGGRPAPSDDDDMDAVLGRAGMPAAPAPAAPAVPARRAGHRVGYAPLLAGAHEGELYDVGHPALQRGREAEDVVRMGRGVPGRAAAPGVRGRAYEDIDTGERRRLMGRAGRAFDDVRRRRAAVPLPAHIAPDAGGAAAGPLGNIPLLPYNPPPRGVDIAAPARQYGELAHRAGAAAAPSLLDRFRAMMPRPRRAPVRAAAAPVQPLLDDGAHRDDGYVYRPAEGHILNAEHRPAGEPLYDEPIPGAARAYVEPRPQEDIDDARNRRPTVMERLRGLWDRRPRLPRVRDTRPEDALELALRGSSTSESSDDGLLSPLGRSVGARRRRSSNSSSSDDTAHGWLADLRRQGTIDDI